jgi:hypothetical protein
MMEKLKVVIRYSDGRLMKGFTQDFFTNKERFHFVPADNPSDEAIEVFTKDLKATFLVRDFIGDSLYHERKK